jgi:hypothetical protein
MIDRMTVQDAFVQLLVSSTVLTWDVLAHGTHFRVAEGSRKNYWAVPAWICAGRPFF